jgi:serine/threonine protein kinase
MDDLVGQQFGSYRLTCLLGRGGFAHVYMGEHIHLQTHVAIKVLTTQLVPKDLERFRREAKIVAALDHPHIVRVFDFGTKKDVPFMVMYYAPQGTVQQRHAQESRLPLATVLEYVQQMAQALQYAHDRTIIHRDVKPENMLVGNQGELLLSDFGIAVVSATSTSQQTKTTAGTAIYMAPEQIMGKPCAASDQYALAIIVYTWLCGASPFQGSFFEICAQHMHAPVPSLREKNPEIPVEVEECVLKALAKDPEQRFTSMRDFALALLAGAEQTLPAVALRSLRRCFIDPDATIIKSAGLPNIGLDDSTIIKSAGLPNIGSDDSTIIKLAALPDIAQHDLTVPAPDLATFPETQDGPAHLKTVPHNRTEPALTPAVTPLPFPASPGQKRVRKQSVLAIACALLILMITILSLNGTWTRLFHPPYAGSSPPVVSHSTATATATQSITPTQQATQTLASRQPATQQPTRVSPPTPTPTIHPPPPPGSVWTYQSSGTSQNLYSVTWSGSQFVVVGTAGTILTSADGRTWTVQPSPTSADLIRVAWLGSQFVIVGYNGTILTSPDGRTWTAQSSGTSWDLYAVTWRSPQFVAVGDHGTILTSPDGGTWTAQPSPTSEAIGGRIVWSGSQFVVVGDGGTILTSPDGGTWTAQSSGTSQHLEGVAWSGSQFVVVGNTGTTLTSPNGRTWTSHASGTSQILFGVVWSRSQYVAVGQGGTILSSP